LEPPSSVLDDYFSRGIILFLSLVVYALISGIDYAFRVYSDGKNSNLSDKNGKYTGESLLQVSLFIKVIIIVYSSSILAPVYAAPLALTLLLAAENSAIQLISGREQSFLTKTRPVIWLIEIITLPVSSFLARFSEEREEEREDRDAQEFEEMTEIIEEAGIQGQAEKKMLKGIAALSNTSVYEIMKPRVEMFALSTSMSSRQVMEAAVECGYSRLPVYEGSPDNIKGFLYVKDLVGYLRDGVRDFEWQRHIRKAYFVPGSKKINDLLEEFRQKKIHLAMVVDEYGGTDGLVTLEDVLEEIVGEIEDESDKSDIS
jgi:CBS domain containing-hemolysin-like protein